MKDDVEFWEDVDLPYETKIRAYWRWMTNRDNRLNCDFCPENHGNFSGDLNGRFECGQYHCWVDCHLGGDE